jgi:hypothetical protein
MTDRDERQIVLILEQELVSQMFLGTDNAAKINTIRDVLARHDREWRDILTPYVYPGDPPPTPQEEIESLLGSVRNWLASK